MRLTNWLDKRVARMNWMDVGLLKICVIAFALMLAKLWPVILTPHWVFFAFLFLLAYGPLKQVQIGKLTEMLSKRKRRRKAKSLSASPRGWRRASPISTPLISAF